MRDIAFYGARGELCVETHSRRSRRLCDFEFMKKSIKKLKIYHFWSAFYDISKRYRYASTRWFESVMLSPTTRHGETKSSETPVELEI